MITLTDEAAGQFQSLLQQKNLQDHGLRIFVQAGGCAGLLYGMAYESKAQEGDAVMEVKGLRFFVDSFSARYLEGASIDYEDTHAPAGFRVDNPNAVTTCACGTSFRIEGGKEVETTCD
jgi:iron-sulfur cluster assembly protein